MNSNLQKSCLSLFAHHGFNFLLRLFYHFLDSRRMDSSVYNQTLQSDSGNLSSNRIKARKNDCLRCIVDNQLYAG